MNQPTAGYVQNSPVQPETEIQSQQRQLCEITDCLTKLIVELEFRLQMVLRPNAPQAAGAGSNMTAMQLTDLGQFLASQTGRVGNASATLQSILERMAL